MKTSPTQAALPKIFPKHSFGVARGIQAGREYYLAMLHLDFIAKHFPFPPAHLPDEKIIQRQINKARIPQIAEYLIEYFDDYVLGPLIVSIDGDAEFTPISEKTANMQLGVLEVPASADFIINDGQHRCAAIREALLRRPELKMETLGVAFYIDRGVRRSRQIFSDLNGHPVRTNSNINTTFDSRRHLPEVTKRTIDGSALLRGRVEFFASSCAQGSPKLFTISAINRAHGILLNDVMNNDVDHDAGVCGDFWRNLEDNLPEADRLLSGEVSAREIKEDYLYPYSIALQTLAGAANQLIHKDNRSWGKRFSKIGTINWRRDNQEWEGRAMSAGRLTTAGTHPTLTLNLIKRKLGLKLSGGEAEVEKQFRNAKI